MRGWPLGSVWGGPGDLHVERILGEQAEAPLAFDRLALGASAPPLFGDMRHAQHRQRDAKRQDDEGHHHRGEILLEQRRRHEPGGADSILPTTGLTFRRKIDLPGWISNGIAAIGRAGGRLAVRSGFRPIVPGAGILAASVAFRRNWPMSRGETWQG